MNIMKNPFIITGYLGKDFFCDREEETKRLIDAANNGRNIILSSIRRLGKTGLIKLAQENLGRNTNFITVYIDIMATSDIDSFTKKMAKSVFEQSAPLTLKSLSKIKSIFSSVTPAITYDALTNQPALELKFHNIDEIWVTLDDIFKYLKNSTRKFHIAIDEFQQISNYPEKNTEAVLRSLIQQCNNLSFVYSGSRKHILMEMFSLPGKPFYQSSEYFELSYISRDKYIDFIIEKFSHGKQKITESDADYITRLARLHTFYVQYLCNKIFNLNEKHITTDIINATFRGILSENESIYFNFRSLLSPNQWHVLRAIAHNEGVSSIMANDFIQSNGLPSASSVKQSADKLLEKELVFIENEKYYISDVFLSNWLKTI